MTDPSKFSERWRKPEVERSASLFFYAVIDLAGVPELTPMVTGRLSFEARTLFAPDMPFDMLAVGPWLANLTHLPELRTTLVDMGGDTPWGYFIHASIDIASLRHTLRRLNLVELPEPRRTVLFRYWDPREIKIFLEIATPEQRALLFEFIDRIEGPGGTFDAWYNGKQTL